jgi:F-box protein 18 (helicase)
MKLTQEQKAIINCKLRPGETLKILAGAGTGKTSTLIEYAKTRPERRMLYLCFNKSVQVEATSKFPKNVECRTGHSLAYGAFGAKYRDKLVPGLKVYSVKNALMIPTYEITHLAIDTLQNFLHSADDYIAADHVPKKFIPNATISKIAIASFAEEIWNRMIDVNDHTIGMLHDGYLKLWQMSGPQLRYDVIILDEAQDTNQTLAHAFFNQRTAIKVLVGDAHQQIYSFRGSRNFMQGIDATQTFMLSQSFRFHSGIADVANTILTTLKNEKELMIIGSGKKSKSISKQLTHIARTNAGIFDGAASNIETYKLAFVGGAKNYKFSIIHDVYRLSIGAKYEITDKYIASFGNYKTL